MPIINDLPPLVDRRGSALDPHAMSEIMTKRLIVGTMCAITIGVTVTVCRLALRDPSAIIPQTVDHSFTLLIGILGGWLGKTGVDASKQQPHGTASDPMVVTPSPDAPATDVNLASQDAPVKVDVEGGGTE